MSTTSGCKDKGIGISEFVVKAQFLCNKSDLRFCIETLNQKSVVIYNPKLVQN